MTAPIVRAAIDDDRPSVRALVRAAFFASDGGREELDIVERTWSSGAAVPGLELVAVDGGDVVGHVLTAFGDLGGQAVAAVAPLAVAPSHQRHGIGTALMESLLKGAEGARLPLVLLLGSPDFYRRFGFEPAAALGITYAAVDRADPAFQARRLSAFDPALAGVFVYCWELDSPASSDGSPSGRT
ncbi:MAG: GNAT family N-acetyltransferase [Acidimicrobiales bacterium]